MKIGQEEVITYLGPFIFSNPWASDIGDETLMNVRLPWGDWSPDAVTALETALWPQQHNPGYLCHSTIETLMQQRDLTVTEIRDLDEKKKAVEDDLFDIDFTIDCRLENDLQPFGMKMLPALEKKLPGFGSDMDERCQFRNVAERQRAVAKGKTLVQEKISALGAKMKLVKASIGKSQNFKVVAIVNEMLRKATINMDDIVKMASKNPSPYPLPNPMTFPGIRPPKKILDKRGYYGWSKKRIERNALSIRKGRTNPRCAMDIPSENMKGMPTKRQMSKIKKWSAKWYKGDQGDQGKIVDRSPSPSTSSPMPPKKSKFCKRFYRKNSDRSPKPKNNSPKGPKQCKASQNLCADSYKVSPKTKETPPNEAKSLQVKSGAQVAVFKESSAVAPKNLPTGSQLDQMEIDFKEQQALLWQD